MTRVTTSTARGLVASAASILGLVLGAASPAVAASPPVTVQAAAANAAFLAYAPPPAGGAKALCLVDTGVNPTPDTTPGLVFATALDGGTPNDVDPLWHGTIDAAIAGGAGHGVLGAWPQLKIVSVRATDVPSPGQSPTYQFDDYVNGILKCTERLANADVAVIVLPLSSKILPTPDQAAAFDNAFAQALARGISILAAAGNETGGVQLPASQPGVFAVGAGGPGGSPCPFSATLGLAFYAPGCGIDQISTTGQAFCCGNGTSQASAFAAGVLVALRSYAPQLTPATAMQFLLSTSHNGQLDVAAAFRAAGLGGVVDAGTLAIPKPLMVGSAPSRQPARRVPRPSVRRATWRSGTLAIVLKRLPTGARLHARIAFAKRKAMFVATSRPWLRVRTPAPRHVILHLSRDGARSDTVRVKVSRRRG
jgi:hypothetical protein